MEEITDWRGWLSSPVPATASETPEAPKLLVVDPGLQYEHAAVNGFIAYADRADPQPVGMQTGLNDLTGESQREYQCYRAYTPVGWALLELEEVTQDDLCPPTMNHRSPAVDYIPPEK